VGILPSHGKAPFRLWTWFCGALSTETQSPGDRSTEKWQGPHTGKKGIYFQEKLTLNEEISFCEFAEAAGETQKSLR